jgi:hypothetical protein
MHELFVSHNVIYTCGLFDWFMDNKFGFAADVYIC